MSETNWNASNYRRRKAERLALAKPEWVANPDTGEKFYLRRVGAMAPIVAGFMPYALTGEAVQAWEGKGVDMGEQPSVSPKKANEEGNRDMQLIASVVSRACVIPKLVNGATKEDELDPSELDDADLMFIFRWATGQVGSGVSLTGGEVMKRDDLATFRKKPGRRIRTGDNSQNVRQAS